MIEIILNWHPIFVHFTIELLSLSVVLACPLIHIFGHGHGGHGHKKDDKE